MTSGTEMLTRPQNYALLIARLCMASLFLWSGLEKMLDYRGAVGFAAHMGVPSAAQLMPGAIILEIGAALALVTGWYARTAAALLAVWMLILGPWFHQFWNAPPQLWQLMVDDFFHHFVMIGGMIYVVVFGPGDYALSRRRP